MARERVSQPVASHDFGPFAAALARLSVFATLPRGWDTYDAEPIAPTATAMARAVLGAVAARSEVPPYFVAPLPNGGVQLEWRRPGGEIEVEVAPNGTFAYLLTEGEGGNRRFTEREDVSFDDMLDLVVRMFADG